MNFLLIWVDIIEFIHLTLLNNKTLSCISLISRLGNIYILLIAWVTHISCKCTHFLRKKGNNGMWQMRIIADAILLPTRNDKIICTKSAIIGRTMGLTTFSVTTELDKELISFKLTLSENWIVRNFFCIKRTIKASGRWEDRNGKLRSRHV